MRGVSTVNLTALISAMQHTVGLWIVGLTVVNINGKYCDFIT